jgi:hypothetical protein
LVDPGQCKNAGSTEELALFLARLERSGTLAQAILVMSVNSVHPGSFTRVGTLRRCNETARFLRRSLASLLFQQLKSKSTLDGGLLVETELLLAFFFFSQLRDCPSHLHL